MRPGSPLLTPAPRRAQSIVPGVWSRDVRVCVGAPGPALTR